MFHIGGQPQSSIFLAPNLAFRYGLTPQEECPSYFIRVWPGGQGTMFFGGFAPILSELPKEPTVFPCPPDMFKPPKLLFLRVVALESGKRFAF